MREYKGKVISEGIAIGTIALLKQRPMRIREEVLCDPKKELWLLQQATETLIKHLEESYHIAFCELGEEAAQVFAAYRVLLSDEEFTTHIKEEIVSNGVCATQAIARTKDYYTTQFESVTDEYIQQRVSDLADVSKRLIDICEGNNSVISFEQPVILAANEMDPTLLIGLKRENLLGLILEKCQATSHAAILIKSMGIVCICDVDVCDLQDGTEAILDGYQALAICQPTKAIMEQYVDFRDKKAKEQQSYNIFKDQLATTQSGYEMKVCANMNDIRELGAIVSSGADGIGLLRSEFIFMSDAIEPSEEKQFTIYKSILQSMQGKRVTIRTLDIGADKNVSYLSCEKENNPALGRRGIRLSLSQPELFKTQLRAIYRASYYGNASILYPMITSVAELDRIAETVARVKEELSRDNIPYCDIEQGIMIETPAAAMISDLLAKKTDFFSIGTNDLTQYTLAMDRQNSTLDAFYDARHTAVLRMIALTAKNAKIAGIPVNICGELAAETSLTEDFICMGIDALSVIPGDIGRLKKIICESHLAYEKEIS